jgi:hypothetical protein
VHDITAVSVHGKIGQLAFDSERVARKAGIDGTVAGRKVLTYAAPTDSGY